ncbi:dipeptidase [Paenibacillus abyssi]|uniref:Diguanylate cyclase n=1 Tax=Paenibacillus abyssi TaxID=1340531 RepID=A0A917D7R8_9BACL|nr:dipeptidase [Paenibacillus abyssi]GGG11754.1 diguanylate cyclase [Paenibacillus abyssi]
MTYKIADFHCDVLSKMLVDDSIDFGQADSDRLDVTYARLIKAQAVLQTFAIYIPEQMELGMRPILRSIDLFYRKVLNYPRMKLVRSAGDLELSLQHGQIGALLSLEGVGGLMEDLTNLRILFYLGVRALGLTWNHANWAADGVMEPRQGGLTRKGRSLVRNCNEMGILLDVSHLTDRGFWELVDESEAPFIASHSNARSICDHPRNLTDEQIRAIIAMDGRIGITFVPWFVNKPQPAVIDDVLRHVEHVCALGGEQQLMLGSDYDGIDRHVVGLSHPGENVNLIEALQKHYNETLVASFTYQNAVRFLKTNLPR